MNRILLCLLLFCSQLVIAQDDKYDKLLALLVDEQYEKVLYKAEPYTLKDETKKDPMPYLYLSMAYFEMSKRGEFEEEYPKAFKESLKYASKHRKKDKKDEYYAEYEDFFAELRTTTMQEAEVFNDQEKYTKSKGYYKYLTSIDKSDCGAWLMKGFTEYKMKRKKDGDLSTAEAQKILDDMGVDHLGPEQMILLKSGFIYIGEFFDMDGRGAEARDWMEKGLEYFEDDKEYMVYYRQIVG